MEIIEQVRLANETWALELASNDNAISNLVFMGMGEPLHNEANVVQACRILADVAGLGFANRHLVVSTAGVGSRIRPFWELGVGAAGDQSARDDRCGAQPNRAAQQAVRSRRIAPYSARHSVAQTRIADVAYLLLEDVNDSREDAQRLSEWIEGLPAKVNLLEFNPYPGSAFRRTSPERLAQFRDWLREFGVFNTLRRSRGKMPWQRAANWPRRRRRDVEPFRAGFKLRRI